MVYGAKILINDGDPVKTNQILLEWDPYTFSILTEVSGVIHFKDLLEGVTLTEQVDEVTGMSQLVVTDSPDEKRQPMVQIKADAPNNAAEGNGEEIPHAHPRPLNGAMTAIVVHAADVLAKIPRETTKTKDITGGLPRVVELFEARKPREAGDHVRNQRHCEVRRSGPRASAASTSLATMAKSANIRFRAAFTSTCRKASA